MCHITHFHDLTLQQPMGHKSGCSCLRRALLECLAKLVQASALMQVHRRFRRGYLPSFALVQLKPNVRGHHVERARVDVFQDYRSAAQRAGQCPKLDDVGILKQVSPYRQLTRRSQPPCIQMRACEGQVGSSRVPGVHDCRSISMSR